MQSHNSFSQETRFLFSDLWKCYWCTMNTCDCLHHIVGRGGPDSKCERSPLNVCLICNHKCHLPNHGKLMTKEFQKKFLKITLDFLNNSGYYFTDLDKEFIKKYKHLY